MDTLHNGPIPLRMVPGVIRPVRLMWAERKPIAYGMIGGWLFVMLALYSDDAYLYGLIPVAAWIGYWIWAGKVDPQYFEILWRQWFHYTIPQYLTAWPGVNAPRVKVEPSVPPAKT